MSQSTSSNHIENQFLLPSGIQFVTELKKDGEGPGAPPALHHDWNTIARWLGHTGDELSSIEMERIGRAWKGYLSVGLAPSHKLQSAFDSFSQQLTTDNSEKPSTEVMNVFDRLLATDDEISSKRAEDICQEGAKFQPIFDQFKRDQKKSWWRGETPAFRAWVFGCISWMLVVLIYALIFDPFDVGGWGYMDDEEMLRLIVVSLIPVAGACCSTPTMSG